MLSQSLNSLESNNKYLPAVQFCVLSIIYCYLTNHSKTQPFYFLTFSESAVWTWISWAVLLLVSPEVTHEALIISGFQQGVGSIKTVREFQNPGEREEAPHTNLCRPLPDSHLLTSHWQNESCRQAQTQCGKGLPTGMERWKHSLCRAIHLTVCHNILKIYNSVFIN